MPAKCDVCHDHDQKYKCPVCQVPYCSVGCFKIHKARCGESPSGPSTQSETPILDVPRSSISTAKKKALSGITRSLDSLRYPPEPEDSSVFDDPLRSEEVKPLRRQDYVNLAKSQDLRRILALPRPEDPPYARPATHIRDILSTLANIKDLQQREQYLAKCLGLEEELHRVRGGAGKHGSAQGSRGPKGSGGGGGGGDGKAGKPTQAGHQEFFLPDPTSSFRTISTPAAQRPNQKHGAKHGEKAHVSGGSGGLFIGAQEQESMRVFAEVVRQVLEGDAEQAQGRGVKRKVEWET